MASVIRPIGYSGSFQQFTVTEIIGDTVTAYLWGGGGGGGPGDGWGRGGDGGGGGYVETVFAVSTGDIIGIGVGGAGSRGNVGGGVGGGSAGAAFNQTLFWASTSLINGTTVARSYWGDFTPFLRNYGIWAPNLYQTPWAYNTNISVPTTGYYQVTASATAGYVTIDGALIPALGSLSPYGAPASYEAYLTAGTHNFLWNCSIGDTQGAFALTVAGSNFSYSGAPGGASGPSGGSGSGGGGGGATVLTLNGNVIAVAGGGGGGGGAGQYSYISQCSAPGLNQQAAGFQSGQAGQSFWGDGGGGGGGGGGYSGGQGGPVRGGETTGYAGSNGTSWVAGSGTAENPNGRLPGGYNSSFRTSVAGLGGQAGIPTAGQGATSGGSGYAVFDFQIAGSSVKDNGVWNTIQNIYAKDSGSWKQVKGVYVKEAGLWKPVLGNPGYVPPFQSVSGNFGVSYRSF